MPVGFLHDQNLNFTLTDDWINVMDLKHHKTANDTFAIYLCNGGRRLSTPGTGEEVYAGASGDSQSEVNPVIRSANLLYSTPTIFFFVESYPRTDGTKRNVHSIENAI